MSKFKIGDKVKLIKSKMDMSHCLETRNRFKQEEVGEIVDFDGFLNIIRYRIQFEDGYRNCYCTEEEIKLVGKKGFTKEDLKIGYLVECRNGKLKMLMHSFSNKMVLIGADKFNFDFKALNEDLTTTFSKDFDIMKVYGRSILDSKVLDFDKSYRKLLWEREEDKKEMTVEQIEKALGYGVKIVKEEK